MTTCYSNIETCLTTMLIQQAWAPRAEAAGLRRSAPFLRIFGQCTRDRMPQGFVRAYREILLNQTLNLTILTLLNRL